MRDAVTLQSRKMELKHLLSHFTYRIESKPEGGFIARGSDPSIPPLEAPTRQELNQKIQQNILATLGTAMPGFKLPEETEGTKFSFHVEHKPDGGYILRSSNPNEPSIEGATHEEIERQFAEKFLGFAGKAFMPLLSKAFDVGIGEGDIQVIVNRKGSFTINSKTVQSFGKTPSTTPAPILPSGSPIVPESNNILGIVRFMLALLAAAGLVYLFLHRH